MKYLIRIVMVCTVFQTTIYAQNKMEKNAFRDTAAKFLVIKNEPRFYVNLHTGYAFALGSTFKFYPDDISSISMQMIGDAPAKTTVYKAPSRGLGQGLRLGAGISYIVNDFINVGIDVDYFSSTISKNRDSSYYSFKPDGPEAGEQSYKERYTISYDATLVTISPNMMFKAISRPKWFVYNKVGLVLTFRPNSLQKESTAGNYHNGLNGSFTDSATLMEKTYDWGIRNPSIGFMGGVGAQFRVSERMRLFSEIQFSHVVFVVRERSLTSYKVNGVELVNTLPVADRELMFEKNLSSNEITNNPNRPARTIIQRIPITYVGAQIGVAYRF